MLPDRCTVSEGGARCPNPPEFVIEVAAGGDKYMIGVVCPAHRVAVMGRVRRMQAAGDAPAGTVSFEPLKAVGTDCVRSDPDLISIG